MRPGIQFYRTEQCLGVYVSYLGIGFLDIGIKKHQGKHRQDHLWLFSNGDGDCVTFQRLTAYHLFLAWYFDATLTTGIAPGTDTLWSSSEIFFTRHLTEFMIKMLSGNKKIFFFQRSAVRTGICAYKDTTPLQTRPTLINRTVNVLFKKALSICFVCWSQTIFCLFVCFYTVS